jgi:hypothetical protein
MVEKMSEKQSFNERNRLLQTSKEIMAEYNLTRRQFKKFIKLGMPAINLDHRWYACTKNIDAWFEDLTAPKKVEGKFAEEDLDE